MLSCRLWKQWQIRIVRLPQPCISAEWWIFECVWQLQFRKQVPYYELLKRVSYYYTLFPSKPALLPAFRSVIQGALLVWFHYLEKEKELFAKRRKQFITVWLDISVQIYASDSSLYVLVENDFASRTLRFLYETGDAEASYKPNRRKWAQ